MKRENTKRIMVGGAAVGGGAGVSVQSMCNTRTSDVEATCAQIGRLAAAGCDIVRLAVPDMDAARAISEIKARVSVPLVADIHFDYRLALEAAARGIDKIRINPGNIGSRERVEAVAKACAARGIPIRIGVNGGSLEKPLLEKYGHPTPEAMLESARGHIRLLNDCGFDDICLSLKASSPEMTVAAYRLAAEELPYPLHLGVTETGTAYEGIIRSAVGIGTLLMEGIGDTIRVSLTADPVEEVRAGKSASTSIVPAEVFTRTWLTTARSSPPQLAFSGSQPGNISRKGTPLIGAPRSLSAQGARRRAAPRSPCLLSRPF